MANRVWREHQNHGIVSVTTHLAAWVRVDADILFRCTAGRLGVVCEGRGARLAAA
jgi:hypothetical protein